MIAFALLKTSPAATCYSTRALGHVGRVLDDLSNLPCLLLGFFGSVLTEEAHTFAFFFVKFDFLIIMFFIRIFLTLLFHQFC